MSNPYFRFYAKDWIGNPALRSCTPAARGTWIDLLALMTEADTFGELKFGDGENWKFEPPTLTNSRKHLARRSGKSRENPGKIQGKSRENPGKIQGKSRFSASWKRPFLSIEM